MGGNTSGTTSQSKPGMVETAHKVGTSWFCQSDAEVSDFDSFLPRVEHMHDEAVLSEVASLAGVDYD